MDTGAGSIGVEFAGTAISSPSPYGQNITISNSSNASSIVVDANAELQWQESYYRGYFELYLSHDWANASFFGTPTIVNRNPFEIPIANFSVAAGANRLARPIAGGVVENGAVKGGRVVQTNVTNDTSVSGGSWFISRDDEEDL